MAVVDIQKPKNPDDKYVWGFDTDANEWVPVDRQAAEGGVVGNLGRAAGRGFEDVMAGLRQATTGQSDPNLAARQAAASAGAPVAEAVGGFAPEAGAAALAGLATGGAGFFPALAAESAAGGAVTAMRPGTFEERILGGLESAGINLVGGAAAAAGLKLGFKVGRGILSATQNRVAAGIEAGAQRVQTSRAAEAAAARETAPAAAEAETVAPGQSTVGAARTPEGELGAAHAQEMEALQVGDVESLSADQIRDRAQELGMKVPFYSGTRQGSPARLLAAGREIMPFGNTADAALQAHNQGMVARYLGEALDEPRIAKEGAVYAHDLDTARGALENKFQTIESRMPVIGDSNFARAMKGISQEAGPFGKMEGQKIIQDAIDQAEARNGVISGRGFMQARSWLAGEMSKLYNAGQTGSADTLWQALQKMDDLAAKTMEKRGQKDLAATWSKARSQWQLLQMVDRPGAVNLATGDLNWRTIFGQMRRGKTRGGFGGRPADGPMRRLYDSLEVHGFSQTQVPFTGARMAAWREAAPTLRQGLGIGAAAAAGGSAMRGLGLWD